MATHTYLFIFFSKLLWNFPSASPRDVHLIFLQLLKRSHIAFPPGVKASNWARIHFSSLLAKSHKLVTSFQSHWFNKQNDIPCIKITVKFWMMKSKYIFPAQFQTKLAEWTCGLFLLLLAWKSFKRKENRLWRSPHCVALH